MLIATTAPLLILYVAYQLVGGGHGTYLPGLIAFPFAMTVAALEKEIDAKAISLAIIQFPVYAGIYIAARERLTSKAILTVLSAIHVAGVITALVLGKGQFI